MVGCYGNGTGRLSLRDKRVKMQIAVAQMAERKHTKARSRRVYDGGQTDLVSQLYSGSIY